MHYGWYIEDGGFRIVTKGTPGAVFGPIFDTTLDPMIPVVLVFVVRIVNGKYEILLLRRSQKVGAMKGKISPVAGFNVKFETQFGYLLVAREEIEKEIGIPDHFVMGGLDLVGGYSEPRFPNDDEKVWAKKLVLAVIRSDAEIVLNWENDEAHWFGAEDLFLANETGRLESFLPGPPAPDLSRNLKLLLDSMIRTRRVGEIHIRG